MKACMFPGQGAQRAGMGAEVFDAFPDLAQRADEILGYSVRDLCLQGPMERLTRTEFTQPALYVVNALSYLRHLDQDGRPDYVLGHSVSEYVALFAAEVIDFETGLRLVEKRGLLMGQATGGGMAAVLGLEAGQVEDVLRRHGMSDVFAANYNTPRQIVVSGRRESVVAAEAAFLEAGASAYVVLPVGGAFHTPFMEDARTAFAEFASGVPFAPPRVPVISNVTARPHDPATIRERMVEQITAPVRWSESLRYLLAKDVTFDEVTEIGPEGPPVVKVMFKRTALEAGPLDAASLAREESSTSASADDPDGEKAAEARHENDVLPCCAKGPAPSAGRLSKGRLSPETLGSRAFCDDFGVRYPYVCGAMYQGIASADLVARMARAGMLSFFGAGGLPVAEVERAIERIRAGAPAGSPFGVNFIAHVNRPHLEDELADLLLQQGVRIIEASAFMEVTAALVRYRAKGLREAGGGRIEAANRIVAKVSRPEVAAQFLAPAPERLVTKLVETEALSADEAELLRHVPMADAICVESDSGGHTDQGMPFTLIPAIIRLRDDAAPRFPRFGRVHVGAGGGLGTPAAAAAVLVLGADFLVTGSVNQCTVEAATSDAVKDMLEGMGVHDTAYAPSGEMFELGAKVQVLKKGVFFPSRAEKLVGLYRQHDSLDAIEPKLRRQIQDRYFQCSFEEAFADIEATYPQAELERAARLPKHRMALVFRRYFKDTTRWALAGDLAHKVDFQVHCGPALGGFNQWVAGTELESWHRRHPDTIAERLLDETATLLNRRFAGMLETGGGTA